MINTKILNRVVIISLITVFSIAGIIACSGDGITGSGGGGYYSSGSNPSAPDNTPNYPDDTPNFPSDNTNSGGTNATPSLPGGDTNSGGTDTPPSLPNYSPDDYYKIHVPFAVGGDGYTNVSYKDTNKLRQLWFDSINRKAANDGRVFAIKNKANSRGANNFQERQTHGQFSAYDYYYFNENGDIVWKEDNTIIKKFMGATIVRYRDVTIERGNNWGFQPNGGAIQKNGIQWSEQRNTIGAIYANTMTTEQARQKYHWDRTGHDPFKDGVFDFIAARHQVETFHNIWSCANNLFERQYINPGFVEVLVMYHRGDSADVHSYYAYYGIYNHYKEYSGHPGVYFTPQNMPYMTNHNIYIGQRPEFTMKQLNHTALFTDTYWRGWHYYFMPGHKN